MNFRRFVVWMAVVAAVLVMLSSMVAVARSAGAAKPVKEVDNVAPAGFVSLFSKLTYEPIGIALPGNAPLFVNWTENFLARLEGTGILDEIGKHWFGQFGEVITAE